MAGQVALVEAPPSVFRSAGLKVVKAVHTLAWFSIEASKVYVLYAGIRGRSDRKAGVAGAVVVAETAIFAGNGFHCPLTAVAQRLGDESGSVTDIYLPGWFARNLPAIHVPLIVLAVALHWRNLRPRVGGSPRRISVLGTTGGIMMIGLGSTPALDWQTGELPAGK